MGVCVSASFCLCQCNYINGYECVCVCVRALTLATLPFSVAYVRPAVVTTIAGSGIGEFADGIGSKAAFYVPISVAVDASGNVFVADQGNNRIRKVMAAGNVTSLAGSDTPGFADGTGTVAAFLIPYGVSVDSSGNVFVADRSNNRIRKVTREGLVSTLAGKNSGFANGQGSNAGFHAPSSVAVDTSGNLFVSDFANNRIRKVTPAGGTQGLCAFMD
jgi:hypothetical protein